MPNSDTEQPESRSKKSASEPIPEEWEEEFRERDPDRASAGLSLHRTELSTHRTQLSTHRTELSTARSHMSNERTHLSYLRTSLALMSFGITVNRFSIVLRESHIQLRPHGLLRQTEFLGLGMVILGVMILAWALVRFRKIDGELETETYSSPRSAVTWMTAGILLLGGVSTIWMFVSRG